MDKIILMELTADIVTAHVSNNAVPAASVANLISAVHGALRQVGYPVPAPTTALSPAVPVRTSVKPDAITCLDCGRKFKTLKRHLRSDHGLTPDAYKARWRLPASYPIVAAEYAEMRTALAVNIGLGRKKRVVPPAPAAEPAAIIAPAPVADPAAVVAPLVAEIAPATLPKAAPAQAKAAKPKTSAAKPRPNAKPADKPAAKATPAKATPDTKDKPRKVAKPRKAKVAVPITPPAPAANAAIPNVAEV